MIRGAAIVSCEMVSDILQLSSDKHLGQCSLVSSTANFYLQWRHLNRQILFESEGKPDCFV